MPSIEQPAKSSSLSFFGPLQRSGALGLILGLCVALTACSKGSDAQSGSGGAAGESSEGGASQGGASDGGASSGGVSGGEGGTTSGTYPAGPAACVNTATWAGVIGVPSPNVSMGKTVTYSDGVTTPALLVDGLYHNGTGTLITPGTSDTSTWTEGWVAVEVGAGPTKLLLTWQETSWNEFNNPSAAPVSYVVETSATGVDGSWTAVAEETDNTIRGRSHVFDFTGMAFVRFRVTAAPPTASGAGVSAVRLDELALFDVSASATGATDGILFMGDSITKMSLGFSGNRPTDVDTLITDVRSAYAPAMIDAGIGGENTAQGAGHAAAWLDKFEGLDFVTVAYGTNDAWGNSSPVSKGYEANLRKLIDSVIAAGKTPILTRIPFANVAIDVLADYNQIVQDLTVEYDLPCGPDLYTYFAEHQDELADDGVHPSAVGQASIRRLYAEALLPLYPTE